LAALLLRWRTTIRFVNGYEAAPQTRPKTTPPTNMGPAISPRTTKDALICAHRVGLPRISAHFALNPAKETSASMPITSVPRRYMP